MRNISQVHFNRLPGRPSCKTTTSNIRLLETFICERSFFQNDKTHLRMKVVCLNFSIGTTCLQSA